MPFNPLEPLSDIYPDLWESRDLNHWPRRSLAPSYLLEPLIGIGNIWGVGDLGYPYMEEEGDMLDIV